MQTVNRVLVIKANDVGVMKSRNKSLSISDLIFNKIDKNWMTYSMYALSRSKIFPQLFFYDIGVEHVIRFYKFFDGYISWWTQFTL